MISDMSEIKSFKGIIQKSEKNFR